MVREEPRRFATHDGRGLCYDDGTSSSITIIIRTLHRSHRLVEVKFSRNQISKMDLPSPFNRFQLHEKLPGKYVPLGTMINFPILCSVVNPSDDGSKRAASAAKIPAEAAKSARFGTLHTAGRGRSGAGPEFVPYSLFGSGQNDLRQGQQHRPRRRRSAQTRSSKEHCARRHRRFWFRFMDPDRLTKVDYRAPVRPYGKNTSTKGHRSHRASGESENATRRSFEKLCDGNVVDRTLGIASLGRTTLDDEDVL